MLDGKIVFAKDTSMLARVVIVEHDNGIHTIYAHLDKIAPNIKVGKKKLMELWGLRKITEKNTKVLFVLLLLSMKQVRLLKFIVMFV